MILYWYIDTDEKEADLAIFFTPDGGMFGKFYIRALGLDYFDDELGMELLLWRPINRGPACESLF